MLTVALKGDFIACIGAFKAVWHALEEHGGAVSEYRDICEELDRIQEIIERVNDLANSTSANNGKTHELLENISKEAAKYQKYLESFTSKISRYNSTLGSNAMSGYFRRTWSKVQWALLFAPEVRKLRNLIQSHGSIVIICFCELLYLHSYV